MLNLSSPVLANCTRRLQIIIRSARLIVNMQTCQTAPLSTTACTPQLNEIASQTANINGSRIHYETAGRGPHHVFMLPGALGCSRTDFLPQLTKLDPEKFSLVCWDPMGYGKSRPPDRTWPDRFFSRDAADAAALIQHIGERRSPGALSQ